MRDRHGVESPSRRPARANARRDVHGDGSRSHWRFLDLQRTRRRPAFEEFRKRVRNEPAAQRLDVPIAVGALLSDEKSRRNDQVERLFRARHRDVQQSPLLLHNRGIKSLIVCGVTTEVCVNTTVREANDRGYECIVLSDCVGSYFPEFQRVALEMIKAQGESSAGCRIRPRHCRRCARRNGDAA